MLAAGVLRRAIARVPVRSMSTAASVAAPTPSWTTLLEPTPKVPREFIIEFPEETEANTFEVNWSLADDDITPRHNAYRNRALHRLAPVSAAAPLATLRAATAEPLHVAPFLDLWNEVTDVLGNTKDLYISDGAIGAHAAVRTSIRVVSDSPALAHVLSNLLVKVPSLKDVHTPRPILVLWESAGTASPAFVYNIDTNEDGFTQAKLVVRGAVHLDNLVHAILSLKTQLDGDDAAAAVVAADVVVDNGATTLVFHATAAARAATQATLAAAHGAIWHPAVGVSPAFQGVVLPHAAVQNKKAKTPRHQTFPAPWSTEHAVVALPSPNVVGHPTTAVVAGAANKDVSAAEFAALVGGSPALVAALEQHKTKCVVKKL
ncbi:Aste57867_671 [Aphanomyces stellatus]|uniref:Aste57867_671 protein n=1 Tax=Aphanomyces stellatus TaxID=120398 RepID=A0A485K3I8_9STRA|nr:hypothetical protein As57867_000670 [Aphanomyces stellatus]VFT77896.1 Aste57867_671 [Aphanomyces stellatus]